MSAASPWENLRFVKKIEIVPGPGSEGVFATLEEEAEYDNPWYDGCVSRVVLRQRKLVLSDETLNFQFDYPDDFKKLVHAMNGDYAKAYEGYLALQKPVPEKWDVELKNPYYGEATSCGLDGEYDCDCC